VPHQIKIRRQAKNKLKSLPRPERERIAEKIYFLGLNPDDKNLDIKKLAGSSFWRLRVGLWRVIYDRRDDLKIISIEKIKPRGDAYK